MAHGKRPPPSDTGPPPAPPFFQRAPVYYFDSAKDGELKGSKIANIVKASGEVRTATSMLPLPQGALISVAVDGQSDVMVETAPDIFILRFGVAGNFRWEWEKRAADDDENILISPGTFFRGTGRGESSLLLSLHCRALEGVLGVEGVPRVGLRSLRKHGGNLRELAFSSARAAEALPEDLLPRFLRNFQFMMASVLGSALIDFAPGHRRPEPMIGRRKVNELCQWATLDRDNPLTIGDLAAHCGLGVRALQKNFLLYFNTTPGLYLREVRLAKARSLLCDASAAPTVTRAALDAGFVHLGRFSALYHERFGELPSETPARTLSLSC